LILNKSFEFDKGKKYIKFLSKRIDPREATKIIDKHDVVATATNGDGR
jgi:hypothetical protein